MVGSHAHLDTKLVDVSGTDSPVTIMLQKSLRTRAQQSTYKYNANTNFAYHTKFLLYIEENHFV